MNNDWMYDIETYPNCFTVTFEHGTAPFTAVFEISDQRNDSRDIIAFMMYLKNTNARMVGFNNIGFDYPVLHTLIRMGTSNAGTLYDKAMAIIASQDDDRWVHYVKPTDYSVEQIDLFKIHHFDNRARSTGLKVLEFNMRSDSIVDLPYPVGTMLDAGQIVVLKEYNAHDVSETKKFYHHTLDMIKFRKDLTYKYQRDFMNHNDTKIGKDYFIMKLEEAGVPCYDFGDSGRKPRQTKRPQIALKDAILPCIEFDQSDFIRMLEWLKDQVITDTKGVFKDVGVIINGFEFVFGLGGIHGSVDSEIIEATDEFAIVDLDVASYYPNLAIVNRLYPEHLGETFCDIYETLYEQRKTHPKGSTENAMLKLALNGVYGDSNNPFSVFYDPLFTMSITLNGQLLLCLLAQELMKIDGLKLIQINTDGITVGIPRGSMGLLEVVRTQWEKTTGLTLEEVQYKRMFIRDVNNYIAEGFNGKVKRKGVYEYDLEWHQDAGGLVIPKAVEKVLLDGAPIRQTIESWPDVMDFMLRTKVPRSSHLSLTCDGHVVRLQNVTRYYVAKGGGCLSKWMPPLKGKTEWRKIGVESGWGVQVCNDIKDAGQLPIDFDYYVREVEKLVMGLA